MHFDGVTSPNMAYGTTSFDREGDEYFYDNDLTHSTMQRSSHPPPPTTDNSTIHRPLPPTTDNSGTAQPPSHPLPPSPPTITNDSSTVQPSTTRPLPATNADAGYEIMTPQEKNIKSLKKLPQRKGSILRLQHLKQK